MTTAVVDASVAIKWFLPEVHSETADRLLRDDLGLQAPDLIRSELGSILWKKCRRAEVTEDVARGILLDFPQFPIKIYSTEGLLEAAWEISLTWDRSFYDSLYLALAQATGSQLVTADLRFYNALKLTPLREHLLWIEEVP